MNKSELITAVAEKAAISKKDADKALNATIEAITEALKKGDKIQLVGFGTFEIRERGERKGPQSPDQAGDRHQGFQAARIQGR